jgi:membrane protein implicated in regulation of membrane protease activity
VYLVADLFAEWWGLSFPQTLLVVALILVIVDAFIQSDIATHVAYVLVCVAVAYWVPVHILFRILVALVVWVLLVYAHYSLWRELVTHFVNRVVAPTKYREGAHALIGSTGIVKEIDGKKMVSAAGDLWPFESKEDPPNEARVKIVGVKGGALRVKIEKEREES